MPGLRLGSTSPRPAPRAGFRNPGPSLSPTQTPEDPKFKNLRTSSLVGSFIPLSDRGPRAPPSLARTTTAPPHRESDRRGPRSSSLERLTRRPTGGTSRVRSASGPHHLLSAASMVRIRIGRSVAARAAVRGRFRPNARSNVKLADTWSFRFLALAVRANAFHLLAQMLPDVVLPRPQPSGGHGRRPASSGARSVARCIRRVCRPATPPRVTGPATVAPRGPGNCSCSAPGRRRCGRR